MDEHLLFEDAVIWSTAPFPLKFVIALQLALEILAFYSKEKVAYEMGSDAYSCFRR
jgi:hypothetical protein